MESLFVKRLLICNSTGWKAPTALLQPMQGRNMADNAGHAAGTETLRVSTKHEEPGCLHTCGSPLRLTNAVAHPVVLACCPHFPFPHLWFTLNVAVAQLADHVPAESKSFTGIQESSTMKFMSLLE